MMPPSKFVTIFNAVVAVSLAVIFFMPVYILLAELPGRADINDDLITSAPTLAAAVHTCLDPPSISPAEDGSSSKEEERLIRTLTDVQTTCDLLELPGKAKQALTAEREDLRGKSYVCVGGRSGLKKYDCLVYSFGVKHKWVQFPELMEKYFGCRVHAFDPALDFIDHCYTKDVRFFNAWLSNIDQQAQYRVPGPPGWKYRTFLTLIKELHFDDGPIDHMRLDITQDLWKGMSTMLKDGSLFTFVKQLSLEYDLNRKNATQIREMYTITQWLNKQGFLLAHSQPTKLSGKSYSMTYINAKLDMSLND